jgi:hypothetical protein
MFSAVLRPCARLQSCSRWVLPSLTREIGSGVKTPDFGDIEIWNGRCQSMSTRSAYRIRAWFGVSQPCIVRGIATAHRSCLVRSKGQPSATKVGIDGTLGKSSPFQVHRSLAMLVSRLINHPGDSLADSRWSLTRCEAGYSTRSLRSGCSVRFAVLNGWCDSVMRKRRSNAIGVRWWCVVNRWSLTVLVSSVDSVNEVGKGIFF